MSAELQVVHDGYARDDGVASSVVLVRDGDSVVVVDPGMVARPAARSSTRWPQPASGPRT